MQATEPGRVSNDIEEVVQAAACGRVDRLFVARDAERWGTFNGDKGHLELHDAHHAGNQDLLDLAAVETMVNEGWLFVVDEAQIPAQGPAAAVLRW